ncbi:MAG: peroxiredoxin [Saprospiraceae bacterium]|nr:peroxiredoxin [Saprospiraceae bacterium]
MSTNKKGNVKVGDDMPEFISTDENGEKVTPATLKGFKNIIFFYGLDDSPTCTKEACNLRDNYTSFEEKGYRIFGVSRDTVKKHQKFIDKYDLPYSLIADPELSMMNAFGYYGPKIFMGKEVNGVYRTTIVTNEKGIITHIIEDVVSGDHSNQLKTALGI